MNRKALLDVADGLDRAGDDAAGAAKALKALPGGSDGVFGGADAAKAVRNFGSVWQREMATQVSALHEIAGKVRSNVASYNAADSSVASQASNIYGG